MEIKKYTAKNFLIFWGKANRRHWVTDEHKELNIPKHLSYFKNFPNIFLPPEIPKKIELNPSHSEKELVTLIHSKR